MSDERDVFQGAEDDRTKKFAVSTTEATADEFKKLADNLGLSQKDLFGAMIELYKASNAVAGVSKVKEIQDLSRHLKRVEEIFVGVVNELGDCREESQRTIQTLHQEHTEKIRQKNEEIDSLKLDLQTVRTMYQEQREKAEEQERIASEARRTIDLIEKANARLEEDNNILRQRVQNLEQLDQENKDLQNQVSELQKESEALSSQVAELEKAAEMKAAAHKEELEKIKSDHKVAIEKIKAEHRAEIDKSHLAHEKEKFQLEKTLAAAADELKKRKDVEIDDLKARMHEMETEKNKMVEELLTLRAEKEKTKITQK